MPGELRLTKSFAVAGDSMLPLLEPGDRVWVRPAPLRAGDLAVFVRFTGSAPALVVHRLVHDGLTRGDACLRPDPPQQAGDFLGRVVAFARGDGRVIASASAAGAVGGAFALLYARGFFCWWREGVMDALERRGQMRLSAALRAGALLPARLFLRLLFRALP